MPPGTALQLFPTECETIEVGDIVVFKTSALPSALVIKRIAAVGGQTLSLKKLSNGRVRVLVDGDSAFAVDGKPYELSDLAASVLKLYEGSLPANTLLVLGRPGTLDSARIGLIPLADVVGVVVLPDTQSDPVTRP